MTTHQVEAQVSRATPGPLRQRLLTLLAQGKRGAETDGLVRSEWDFPSPGPARCVDTITERGLAYVHPHQLSQI